MRRTPSVTRRLIPAIALAVACAGGWGHSFADHNEEKARKDPWNLKVFRFEFDNDTFLGSDDAFSAGWSFQIHSRLGDEWDPAWKWMGKIPSLGDDGAGGRVVRWAWGLSQIILTPTDISISTPQPNDVPWAGTLGITASAWSNNNRRLGAVQIYFGCMGPCSYAEQVQTFIHEDLGFGQPPEGWDNQLSNQVLGNLNYEYRYKLYAPEVEHYVPGRFAHDVSVGGQAAAGNLTTFLQAQVEYRFGWGLPMGFTKIPDPAGIGMVGEPVYFDPNEPLVNLYHWRYYFNVVARYADTYYLAPVEGGPTESGYNHPKADKYPNEEQLLFGMHFVRVPFGLHITYYRYLGSKPTSINGSTDWVNLSFEYRF